MARRATNRSICVLPILFLVLIANSASALVTVTLFRPDFILNPIALGDTFDVDITVSWDGAGSLTGVFASHVWDNTQLALVGAVFPLAPAFETRPTILHGGSFDPQLDRLGTIASGVAGDDLSSSARTVQYVGLAPLNPATSATANQLVTRLTFQLIGIGDGTPDIVGTFLPGDVGAIDDRFTFATVITPEPNSILLLGLGLIGLAGVAPHKR